jgi:Ca2+:H+ antiporter
VGIAKSSLADSVTLKFSRGLSIVYLLAYVLFVRFQTTTHTPPPSTEPETPPVMKEYDEADDDSSLTIRLDDLNEPPTSANKSVAAVDDDGDIHIHPVASLVCLLVSAGLASVCAEFMVASIEHVIADAPLTEAFLGLIILPLLGNVAELATAVGAANRQKMDLAINVTVGSAIQISLFMAPVVVLLGWATERELSLAFDMFQLVTLVTTMLIVTFMMGTGRTHYLLGVLLCICYVVIGYVFVDFDEKSDSN